MTYADYTVEELKEELRDRGLSPTGNKDELITRLEEDDVAAEPEAEEEPTPEPEPEIDLEPVARGGVGAAAPDDRLQIGLPVSRTIASPPH